MKFIDLTGQKFGRLMVIQRVENIKGRTAFLCKCDCGNLIKVIGHNLKTGTTKSCGCLAIEQSKINVKKMIKYNAENIPQFKHGLCKHRLFRIWANMHDRCMRKKCPAYKDYGGRGITICQEWINDFMNFYNWSMANGYKDCLSLDRINFNGNYEPSNCRWANSKTQNRNSRQCVYYEYKGEKYTRGELAELSGLSYDVIRYRLNHNWDVEKAVTLELNYHKKNKN
jgi:hypothetical protein